MFIIRIPTKIVKYFSLFFICCGAAYSFEEEIKRQFIRKLKGLPTFPIGRRRHLFTLHKSSVKAIVIVKTNLIGDLIDRKITVTKKPLGKCNPKIRNIIEDGFAGIFPKLPAYIKFAQITFGGNLVQGQFLRK